MNDPASVAAGSGSSVDADIVINWIDDERLAPRSHKVCRALAASIPAPWDIQRDVVTAFDQGADKTELLHRLWDLIAATPLDEQGSGRICVGLLKRDEPVDWHFAGYLILWSRQCGIPEQSIIDAFGKPGRKRLIRHPVLRIGIGIALVLFLLALAFVAFAYWEAAFRDPAVRRAEVALDDWPKGAKPVTVLLVSDTHVAGPDMPPDRLVRLVEKLNALKPDLVLLAGDYISHKRGATRHYRIADAVAPLTHFKAPLGVIAVLGNHDHWAGSTAFEQAIRATDITLLSNEAIRRGPLIVAGLDDQFSGHADFAQTGRALDALGSGPRLLLTHAPDVARFLPFTVDAMLAGHTHCGQIDLPFIGMPANDGHAFAWLPCGRVRIGSMPLFVGAGLGTSIIPFRFGAPPDVWLIRFGPK